MGGDHAPGFSPGSPDTPVTTLPEIDLKSVGGNRYEATYDHFDTPGVYHITLFANDRRTELSHPVQTYVIRSDGTKVKDDINADGASDLKDAIIALKVAAGVNDPLPIRSDYESSEIDLDGEGNISVKDVVRILRVIADIQ